MSTQEQAGASIADWEREEIEAANAGGGQPVVFVHGLWLLPSSWDDWAELFAEAGYAPLAAGLAGRSRDDVEEAKANPEVFANKKVGAGRRPLRRRSSRRSTRKPALVGHSFGGLLAQILAGRGSRRRRVGDRPGAVPRRAAAALLGAEVGLGRC